MYLPVWAGFSSLFPLWNRDYDFHRSHSRCIASLRNRFEVSLVELLENSLIQQGNGNARLWREKNWLSVTHLQIAQSDQRTSNPLFKLEVGGIGLVVRCPPGRVAFLRLTGILMRGNLLEMGIHSDIMETCMAQESGMAYPPKNGFADSPSDPFHGLSIIWHAPPQPQDHGLSRFCQ